jgi:hypothetical protein
MLIPPPILGKITVGSVSIHQGLWWQKVSHKLFGDSNVMTDEMMSKVRVVIWQQASVMSLQLPQGIHEVFIGAGTGMKAVTLAVCIIALHSRKPAILGMGSLYQLLVRGINHTVLNNLPYLNGT